MGKIQQESKRVLSIKRVILIVLDSCGIGELPDAGIYGDEGSNTLVNTAAEVGGLTLPNLERLGLGKIAAIRGLPNDMPAMGNFGKMAELSVGKDSTAGHWEMMGVVLRKPFPVFPKGFPKPLIEQFEDRIGTKVIGNYPASGTEIIENLGAEHLDTGYPIVYTSGDSVFQVAAQKGVIPLERLYVMCRIARELLTGPYAVGRVIARPFTGQPGSFKRTAERKDFSISPPGDTILDQIVASGREVVAIGKIDDLFGGRGVTQVLHTESNQDGVKSTIDAIKSLRKGLIFTTLVDFDTLWGHRNDPSGFAKGLELFDSMIPDILSAVGEEDLLIFTADHGCDPTTSSTDHSREYVPLLVYGKSMKWDVNLGTRKTFADIGQTIAEIFSLPGTGVGSSFLEEIAN